MTCATFCSTSCHVTSGCLSLLSMAVLQRPDVRFPWRILCFLLVFSGPSGATINVKVGVLLISGNGAPYDYERTAAAVDLAVEKVNSDVLVNTSHRLEAFIETYGPECDAATAPGTSSPRQQCLEGQPSSAFHQHTTHLYMIQWTTLRSETLCYFLNHTFHHKHANIPQN